MQNQITNNWQLKKLTELGELNRGRSRHRPRDAKHLYGGPHPFIQTGDVKASNGRITFYTQTYSEEGLRQSRMWPKDTICITIAANIADLGKLTFPACFPDSVIGFLADKEKSDPDFILYSLQHLKRNIRSYAIGSAQDNINLGTFENVLITTPKLSEQKKIARVLSTLDDKIEINNKIAKTLEEMAQTLFKEWFTRNISPDWETSKFENYAKLEYGKALQEGKRIPGKVLVFGSSGKVGTHNEKLCTGPGIVVGRKGNVGSVFWIDEDFYPIDTTFYINSKISQYYIYFILKNMRFHTGDSAVPGLNRESVHSFEILIPDEDSLRNFEKVVSPIFKKLAEIKKENQKLAALRDLLLPKLMKGEILVNN